MSVRIRGWIFRDVIKVENVTTFSSKERRGGASQVECRNSVIGGQDQIKQDFEEILSSLVRQIVVHF